MNFFQLIKALTVTGHSQERYEHLRLSQNWLQAVIGHVKILVSQNICPFPLELRTKKQKGRTHNAPEFVAFLDIFFFLFFSLDASTSIVWINRWKRSSIHNIENSQLWKSSVSKYKCSKQIGNKPPKKHLFVLNTKDYTVLSESGG